MHINSRIDCHSDRALDLTALHVLAARLRHVTALHVLAASLISACCKSLRHADFSGELHVLAARSCGTLGTLCPCGTLGDNKIAVLTDDAGLS